MARNIFEVYTDNPTTSLPNTSLIYIGNAPFGLADDSAILASDFLKSVNSVTSSITDDTTTNATMYPVWVTASSGPLPLKVSSTSLTFNPLTGLLSTVDVSISGDFTFAQTNQRILADFSNVNPSSRLLFRSSTVGGATNIGGIPNGVGTFSSFIAYSLADPGNAATFQLFADNTNSLVGFNSASSGTGTTKPIAFRYNGTTALSITNTTVINIPFLTASQVVATNSSKDLTSINYDTANTVSALVQRDGSGNFSAGTITAALSGTATNATNTAITDDTATNATMYPTWVTTTTGNLPQKVSSSKLTFNPSTGALSTLILRQIGVSDLIVENNSANTNTTSVLIQSTTGGINIVPATGKSTFIDSGLKLPRQIFTASGNTSLSVDDVYLFIDKTIGAATGVSLPSPSSDTDGVVWVVKDAKGDAATNNITITPTSGTIDNAANYVINSNLGSVTIVGTNAEYFII